MLHLRISDFSNMHFSPIISSPIISSVTRFSPPLFWSRVYHVYGFVYLRFSTRIIFLSEPTALIYHAVNLWPRLKQLISLRRVFPDAYLSRCQTSSNSILSVQSILYGLGVSLQALLSFASIPNFMLKTQILSADTKN